MKTYKRSGDHNFHEVDEFPKGEKVKHGGSFIFGVGEASNHNHVITVPNVDDMEIIKDKNGNYYFNLKKDGILTHVLGDSTKTADHKPIPINKGKYVQVQEREVDIFSSAVRKVLD